jgi:hypothetical protein
MGAGQTSWPLSTRLASRQRTFRTVDADHARGHRSLPLSHERAPKALGHAPGGRTRPPASPQVAHRFEAFQKALPRRGPLQSTAVAQSVTRSWLR